MLKHKKQQKVMLATPHGHEVSARWTKCVLRLVAWDTAHHGRIVRGGDYLLNSSGANITNARNEIVAKFLDHSDEDWLWFVDTDMTFEPDILDRLIESAHPVERPIMGALCFSLQDGWRACPTLYVPREDGTAGRTYTYERNKIIRSWTGSGCLLIHRTVLETMRERGFNPAFAWFQETNLGGLPIGEDLTFCIRAESLGFPVHVDTAIKCGHEKPFIVDESMYDAQRQAAGAEQPDTILPTYAVIASRHRPEMLAKLRRQLEPQVTGLFVFDNGYTDTPKGSIPAFDWPLHRMWNEGLDHAANAAQGPYNVLVINDDVEVSPHLVASLEGALRADEDHWIAFPHPQVPEGMWAATQPTSDLAGQTMTGWCFMLRGEAGLRLDEQFEWWYGDSDLERTVRERGKKVVGTGVPVTHLDPMRSTLDNPERLDQAKADEKRFAAKWNLDPSSLWLARNAGSL